MDTKPKGAIVKALTGENLRGKGKCAAAQSLLVFLSLGLILLLFDLALQGVIVASLGASSFILFVTPHTASSRTANLVGGYICACVSGVLLGFAHEAIRALDFERVHLALIIVCACAAAATMFLMVYTGFVHPPSAALALGLAADTHGIRTAAAALLGIAVLCAVRNLLKKHLKNLV
ncbi:MAG: HPP family protein [Oscillospiraceae bacterium]|jgi:CBS-domain-containing membrane protein|nr:HPP family protein [Oscillospiraceae bacterium]